MCDTPLMVQHIKKFSFKRGPEVDVARPHRGKREGCPSPRVAARSGRGMQQTRRGGALLGVLVLALVRTSRPASLGLRTQLHARPTVYRASCVARELPEVLTAPPSPPPPPVGRPHTPESRAKISASNKGKIPWNNGRKHPAETIARIRERTMEVMRERVRAKEQWLRDHPEEAAELARQAEIKREKRLQAQRELRAAARAERELAKKAAKEEAAARQVADKAAQSPPPPPPRAPRVPRKPPSPEVRARIAATLRLRWQDPAYRAGRRVASPSEETRAKLAAAMRLRWQNMSDAVNQALGGQIGDRSHSLERRVRGRGGAVRKPCVRIAQGREGGRGEECAAAAQVEGRPPRAQPVSTSPSCSTHAIDTRLLCWCPPLRSCARRAGKNCGLCAAALAGPCIPQQDC